MSTDNPMQNRIKHVVVIMLENRGFDTALGYLYSPNDLPKQHLPALKPGEPAFHGLCFVDTQALSNPSQEGLQIPPMPSVRATNSTGWNPGEEYEHVNMQLFGSKTPPTTGQQPTMKGFLQDYSTRCDGDLEAKKQIMHMYTPADLPVINGLAKGYAVSDMWFASVPTQTNANRAFSLCGTSMGLVDNGFLSPNFVSEKLADDRFNTDTIWNVLDRHNFYDWEIFWYDNYPPLISHVPYTRRVFPHLERIPNIGSHFHQMDDTANGFFAKAEAGTLPAFSYIEPAWGGGLANIVSFMGNEYHPPSDVTPGEYLLERIYQSLTKNPTAWKQTLLVIVFDEHGGTYDSVPPPWGATPPWGSGQPGFQLQHNFQFDRFGVRIPAILVSPYIEEGTVFRSPTNTPYDHTSIVATILQWAGIPKQEWNLGERVANAPTFENVLTRTSPRTDNIFAVKSPPAGTPLKYGDPFYLQHVSGEYVIHAYSGISYYFPQLGQKKEAVSLDFRFGCGEVNSGATVQIRTQEYLEPSLPVGVVIFAGIRNFLGAWWDQHDCYYYSSNDTKNYGEQYWQVFKVDGSTGPIRYGDKVYIACDDRLSPYRGQRLKKDGRYITTATGANDVWEIAPPQVEPRRSPQLQDLQLNPPEQQMVQSLRS